MADDERQKALADKYGGGRAGSGAVADATKRLEKSATSRANISDIAKAFTSGGSTQAVSTKNPLVFMGTTSGAFNFGQGQGATGVLAPGAIKTVISPTLSEVSAQYYSWDQKQKDKFISQLGLAGYDTTTMKDGQAAALWAQYAQESANYFQGGDGQQVTPWDILAMDRQQREAANKPRTVTQTSTNANLSSAGDAKALFMQAAQSLLGRDPTAAEAKNFQAALNAMERANPTVTTQTSNYIGQELQNSSSTTTGGVGEGAKTTLAMDDIKKDPEYGAFQAATNGMNWLQAAIGG